MELNQNFQMLNMHRCSNEVRFLHMHHVCNIGAWDRACWPGNRMFSGIFGHERHETSAKSPISIVTRANKLKCLNLSQSSELDGVGCKDFMVCGKHATKSAKYRPG